MALIKVTSVVYDATKHDLWLSDDVVNFMHAPTDLQQGNVILNLSNNPEKMHREFSVASNDDLAGLVNAFNLTPCVNTDDNLTIYVNPKQVRTVRQNNDKDGSWNLEFHDGSHVAIADKPAFIE
jgi:uncharacterized cupredoxin-like copper-binding protein